MQACPRADRRSTNHTERGLPGMWVGDQLMSFWEDHVGAQTNIRSHLDWLTKRHYPPTGSAQRAADTKPSVTCMHGDDGQQGISTFMLITPC